MDGDLACKKLNEFIDSEDYIQELEEKVESITFPNPDPKLIPELTKARFIAEQSIRLLPLINGP